MKLSQGFWQTYKEVPADAEIPSHQLMVRAGLIHKSGSGLYTYLPFAYRSIRKVEQIVREEMDAAGCYELLMNMVTPGDLWRESGRWSKMGEIMLTFKDKADRDMCLSPTNEEAVVDVFRKIIKSYKNLPVSVYQINTKFRDEIRPRFGLMRGREFIMKDAYSFHLDKASLDEVYDRLYQAYSNVFKRMNLVFSAVEADAGAMGSSDSKTHEFQVVADSGEDLIVHCPDTGYAANIEKAQTTRGKLDFFETEEAVKEIPTPGKATIEDVCNMLGCPQHHSLKSLVYKGIYGDEEKFVLIMLLGDDQLNEVKLTNYLGCDHLVAATDNELKSLGFEKGYIGPYQLGVKIDIVFDDQVDASKAYVTGANKADLHFGNFIPSRDMSGVAKVDLRLACEGDFDPSGSHKVQMRRGIEVGHIFQLGQKYTESMDVKVLDQNGKGIYPYMGCYGIGITRTVAAAIEQSHDEKGIIWPKAIAPYQVHFILISKDSEFHKLASDIYDDLWREGIEVVLDDRNAGPGFKFKDADLLGLPIQLTLGERDFKATGEFEIASRRDGKKEKVKRVNLVSKIKSMLTELT